jgi:tetratricopeptide (TPR) repeat protein
MKTKVVLLAIGCLLIASGAFAQKGVDNGTRFGSGEDSIRCVTNISLFVPYAKAGNFKDAYEFWKIVYEECPAATKDIYLYGVRIVEWQLQNEKDASKKETLFNNLMEVYDKRVKYFGDDRRYGKDWIVSRKAQDYFKYAGDKADYEKAYGWLKEVVNEFGEKTEPLAVNLYMFASYQRFAADQENKKGDYVNDYLKASSILDAQLTAAKAANNEKEINSLTVFKSNIDNSFANSGAADCETLQSLYADKVEQNKDNLEFLKETISLLRRVRCQEIDAYFAASGYAHAMEPTAESAIGLGKQAVKKKDYDTAISFFEEAANMESDPMAKADDYYMIALLYFDQNSYSKARQYSLKALENNPNYGNAYMLIGKMYAATASSIYPNDAVLKKTVYYAAVDKFERARQVDSNCAADAAAQISAYRAYFPSTEEIFMHPDLEKGKTITIGGWIGERTVVR